MSRLTITVHNKAGLYMRRGSLVAIVPAGRRERAGRRQIGDSNTAKLRSIEPYLRLIRITYGNRAYFGLWAYVFLLALASASSHQRTKLVYLVLN